MFGKSTVYRWLALCLACILVPRAADAALRVTIFAADYAQAANQHLRLDNTLIDAAAVAALFRKLPAARVRLVINPQPDTWHSELEDLRAALRPDDVAIIYYAGHALQVGGQNYFVSADGLTLVPAEQILRALIGHARGVVFFIDACRNNPFNGAVAAADLEVRRWPDRPGEDRGLEVEFGGSPPATLLPAPEANTIPAQELRVIHSGLAEMGNVRGSNALVFFSTDPGNVALDGTSGQGSPFAIALRAELEKHQSLDAALRRVTADVYRRTGGRQSPWRQGDLGFPLFLAGEPRFPVP